MKSKEFEMLMDQQIERLRNKLAEKADEYATDRDRLHNFQQAADLQSESLREALGGMMAKHTVSIYDMIQDQNTHPLEIWNEKITDHIAYLVLLNAVINEESLENKGLSGGPEPIEVSDFIEENEEAFKQEAKKPDLVLSKPTPADLANRRSVNA